MDIKGKITKVLPVQAGTSKAGKEWKKLLFIVETEDEYNNLYCFEVFGEEKVDNFIKYNKVGQTVTVAFNVSTNEWQGKYFTSLSAWRIDTDNSVPDSTSIPNNENAPDLSEDDLPF